MELGNSRYCLVIFPKIIHCTEYENKKCMHNYSFDLDCFEIYLNIILSTFSIMSLWFTMVFSKWQFPMLLTCAVNISISTSLVCTYTKSIRRQWDDTYLVWRYLMKVPVFWSSPQNHPAPKFSALPETKVTSLDQGHISSSRSYLLIKFLSMIIKFTSIYRGHIYLSRSHLWSRSRLSIQSHIYF